METKKQKIARLNRLLKHYRERLWDSERVGNTDEASKIKGEISILEHFQDKLISNRN